MEISLNMTELQEQVVETTKKTKTSPTYQEVLESTKKPKTSPSQDEQDLKVESIIEKSTSDVEVQLNVPNLVKTHLNGENVNWDLYKLPKTLSDKDAYGSLITIEKTDITYFFQSKLPAVIKYDYRILNRLYQNDFASVASFPDDILENKDLIRNVLSSDLIQFNKLMTYIAKELIYIDPWVGKYDSRGLARNGKIQKIMQLIIDIVNHTVKIEKQ